MQRLRETRIRKRWLAVVFAGAACAGLLVGLWLSRNASFHRDQKCEKLYDDAWHFFAKKKIEDGALALNVLFTTLPSCEKAPDAGYYSGVVKEFYTHELPQAQQIFRTVTERYPGTDAAEKAREKLNVYAGDEFQWYKEHAQGSKLTDATNFEDVVLPEIFGAYKDDVEKAILHLQFLREGKRILHDTDAEQAYAYLKAILLKADGRYGSAQDILEKLAGGKIQTPLQQRAQLHFADVFFRKKKYKDALDTLDKVTDAQLARFADYGRGEIYFAIGNTEKASEYYFRARSGMFDFTRFLRMKFYPESLLFSGIEPDLRQLQCAYKLGKWSELAKSKPDGWYKTFLYLKAQETLNIYEKRLLPRELALSAFLTAVSYEAQGKTKQAGDMYEKVLKLEKPEGDPDNIFPETIFSAAELYFNVKKVARAKTLFSQFEKNYPQDARANDAKAYGYLCLEGTGKAEHVSYALLEDIIDKTGDASLTVSLYYLIVKKHQISQGDELPSSRELVEEEQAKRFRERLEKKLLSEKTKTAYTAYEDVVLGDISYYSGNMQQAMNFFKDSIAKKDPAAQRKGFEAMGTFSPKPGTAAAYLKKCVQREKIMSLEKQIEKDDSAALHTKLAEAYSEIGWAESAFSQWRQSIVLDAQSYVPQYKKDMEEFLADMMQMSDAALKKNALLEEDAALDAEDAASLLWKVFYSETLLKTGLSQKFPSGKNELERILNQNGSLSGDVWASLLKEKTFYIPPTDSLRDFQRQVIDVLQLFVNEESTTVGSLRNLKFKCEELLAQLQEAEG